MSQRNKDINSVKSSWDKAITYLKDSTYKLVILDEIGRGTSTYDGLSIAWSILEYINTKEEKKFRTLFATHFHELTKLPETFSNIINLQVAVHEENNSIIQIGPFKGMRLSQGDWWGKIVEGTMSGQGRK